MPITHAGDRFENLATRAGDTDGRYMQSETRVRPGGAVSVAHRHRECTERFEVLEGELTVQIDGQTRTLLPGEQVTIAPGAAHHYANRSAADVVFRFDVWPAARFEAMVVTPFALATEGRTDDKGRPSPLQMAVILDEYDDVLELAGPAALAAAARHAAAGPHRPRPRPARQLRAPRRRVHALAGDRPLLRPGSPSHREGLAWRTLTRSW